MHVKMSLSFLNNKNLQFIFFGGKGGVGKTTCATAAAIYLAKENPNKKILIFSTDPAHSLSDSFAQQIGDNITSIRGFNNLYAYEMNAQKVYNDFRRKHELKFLEVANRSTVFFDTKDLISMMSCKMTGVDEIMGLKKIIDLTKNKEYDLVIIDTAPTGHTLVLLSMPEQMKRAARFLKRSQERYQKVKGHFMRGYVKDDIDKFLDEQENDIRIVKETLTNTRKTEFVPVTIPEAMGIYETEKLLKTLKIYKIPVKNIIINRVNLHLDQLGCKFCTARVKSELRYINELSNKFPEYNIIKMPKFPDEVRGPENLIKYTEIMSGENYRFVQKKVIISNPKHILNTPQTNQTNPKNSQKLCILNKKLKFLFFGGKGGVGKTTSAAATALQLAKTNPDKKILIFSTDPAHSLSDSFDQQIGEEVALIKGTNNLYALEANPDKEFEEFKRRYKKELDTAFKKTFKREQKNYRISMSYDERTMEELTDLAPPGMNEIMALIKITDFVEEKKFDLFIFDTAPTGHLVRLLEMPDILKQWISVLIKIQIRYKKIMTLHNVMVFMLETKKKIVNTQKIFTCPEETEFVAVTIPEAMGMYETQRLLTNLKDLKIPAKNIIINRVISPTDCCFCGTRRKKQFRYLNETMKRFQEYRIIEMPLFPHEMRGMTDLMEFGKVVFS